MSVTLAFSKETTITEQPKLLAVGYMQANVILGNEES